MKTILRLLILSTLLQFETYVINAQDLNWAHKAGSANDQFAFDMVKDAQSNVYIVGNLNGNNVDFDPSEYEYLLSSSGGSDIFIAKYDSSGDFLWAKVIGGSGDDFGARISIDSENDIFITGWFNSSQVDFDAGIGSAIVSNHGNNDIYLASYDSEGNYRWAFAIGSSLNEGGHDICIDSNNNILITGYFYGNDVDFDPDTGTYLASSVNNSGDIFIAKYTKNGNFLWMKKCSGISYEVGNCINVDVNNNIFIAGAFKETVDFDPSANVVNQTSNGGYDIFVAKFDENGNFLWVHKIGGTLDDIAGDLVSDSNGDCIFVSYFKSSNVDFDAGVGVVLFSSNGGNDIVFSKYNNQGEFLWAKQIGGSSDDYGVKILTDNENNIYHCGMFKGTVDFDPSENVANIISNGQDDIYFAKYNPHGEYYWAAGIGGISSDFCNSMAISENENVFISGGFYSNNIDFDLGSGITNLSSSGGADIFLAAYQHNSTGLNNLLSTQNYNFVSFYPNPAKHFAYLSFNIVIKEFINLTIENINGKIVKTIISEIKEPGSYNIQINLQNIIPGIYLCRFKTSSFMDVKKLIIING